MPAKSLLLHVDYHLRCLCEYDLYTRPVRSDCPECGMSIAEVMLAYVQSADRSQLVLFEHPDFSYVMEGVGRSLEASLFFVRACQYAHDVQCGKPGSGVMLGFHDLTASLLCLAVRDVSYVLFGASAGKTLDAWSLGTALGVAAMVDDLHKHVGMVAGPNLSAVEYLDCPDPHVQP